MQYQSVIGMKSSFWHFNAWKLGKDSDWGEDDSSGISIQPDHGLNAARPHGKPKHKKKRHMTDAECKTCHRQLVNGSCESCDWGDRSVSDWTDNYPLDVFRDDKAGIRAGGYIPVAEEEPVDKDQFGPDDWYYQIDRKYNPPKFWVVWPARNSGKTVTKEELDEMLANDSGQLKLWQGM